MGSRRPRDHVRLIEALCGEHGATMRRVRRRNPGSHVVYEIERANGTRFRVAVPMSKPSDWRSMPNARAQMRRRLRADEEASP